MVVTGPGLRIQVEIKSPETWKVFSPFWFEDIRHPVEARQDPGHTYVITRLMGASGRPGREPPRR
jgi:hypothetical protein